MAANSNTTIYGKISNKSSKDFVKSQRKDIFGLNFPLGSASSGNYFSKSSGINMVRDAIKQLILTERGERIMLPNFGCNIRKYLFQPLDETTFSAIRREIEFSFKNYIVGADLIKLLVYPTGDTGPAGGNSLKVVMTVRLNTEALEIFDVEVTIA